MLTKGIFKGILVPHVRIISIDRGVEGLRRLAMMSIDGDERFLSRFM